MSSVPDTTTFTLADVVAAVLPSSNDLVECFDDADDGAFDSSYGPGDEDELLQFRNYGNVIAAQNEVYITTNSPVSPGAACSANRTVLAWKNRNPNSVSNGDKFWEDDNGSPGDPYPGGGEVEFFGAFAGLNSSSFKLSSLGIVSNATFCNLPSLTLTDVYYYPKGSSTPTTPVDYYYSSTIGIASNLSTPVDYYYSSTIGNASNLTSGDIIYTDVNLTTPLPSQSEDQSQNPGGYYNFYQNGSSATTTYSPLNAGCGDGAPARFQVAKGLGGIIQIITNPEC
jgi:hypothetical protein